MTLHMGITRRQRGAAPVELTRRGLGMIGCVRRTAGTVRASRHFMQVVAAVDAAGTGRATDRKPDGAETASAGSGDPQAS